MCELQKSKKLGVDSINDYDSSPTKEENIKWSQQRFEFERDILMHDKAYMIDREDWSLAFDSLERMEKLLRDGAATKNMQIILADYLAKQILNLNEKAAYSILGIANKGGRPNRKFYVQRAIATYEICISEGKSEEQSIEATWQALYPDKDVTAERLKLANDDGLTPYQWTVKNTIKPLLRDAKVRPTLRGGRPRKTSNKP